MQVTQTLHNFTTMTLLVLGTALHERYSSNLQSATVYGSLAIPHYCHHEVILYSSPLFIHIAFKWETCAIDVLSRPTIYLHTTKPSLCSLPFFPAVSSGIHAAGA